MTKVLLIVIAGLDQKLLQQTPGLKTLGSLAARLPLRPVLPAVTATMQATLTTGVAPCDHGIIANGLYTHNRAELHPLLDLSSYQEFRRQTSFWEQSNALLETPRFWQGSGKKVAMLFWQNSMDGAADVVITPKPTHGPDGKTLTACWTSPTDLYSELVAKFGPFPLMNYWGPMAALASTQWILRAAEEVYKKGEVDLELVYVPQLDYNLQRRGPSDASVIKDLQDVDAALAPLVEMARNAGTHVVIVGDYAMTAVDTPIFPNLVFRQAGLLATRPDEQGKLLVDYDRSTAFAMVDHQIAHIYCHCGMESPVFDALKTLVGVERIVSTSTELENVGLCHGRSGDIVLLAKPNAWFAHDWWLSDAEKPAWQFSVDIHRKPGYDPVELFVDPATRSIPLDASLVRGSHGRAGPAETMGVFVSSRRRAALDGRATVGAAEVMGLLLGD